MPIPPTIRDQFSATYDFIHSEVLDELDWPDILTAVSHRQGQSEGGLSAYAAILPMLTCRAMGGETEKAIPLAAAWVLYDLASDVFDDLQDRDAKDLPWNHWPSGRAMTVGLGLIFAAQASLARLRTTPAALKDILASLAGTGLAAAQAQGQESNWDAPALYFRNTIAKSGLVFAAVARAGARLGSRRTASLQRIYDYGLALGTLIQIRDDCFDVTSPRALSDLAARVYTLPVIYALSQSDHPRHARLTELLDPTDPSSAPDEKAIQEVSEILSEMGSLSYSFAVAKVYEQKALSALEAFPPRDVIHLQTYATELLAFFGSADE